MRYFPWFQAIQLQAVGQVHALYHISPAEIGQVELLNVMAAEYNSGMLLRNLFNGFGKGV
ncbi:hypothetical protein D3C87_2060070 [compost metagenome]